MRHMILVMGYGNDAAVLQEVINHFDDSKIDFLIHWDARYNKPHLYSTLSKINFISAQPVCWGTFDQIKVELRLLQAVQDSTNHYDYVHLISSQDIPLMSKKYFISYFNQPMYLGSTVATKNDRLRISYYYPRLISNLRTTSGRLYIKLVQLINRGLKINRLKKYPSQAINKGANWFSIQTAMIQTVLDYPHLDMFKHSYLADELFLQTIFAEQLINKGTDDDNQQAARYIDWRRGKPYTFTQNDVPELSELIDTKYAFARKINDPNILIKLFK